MKFILKKLKSTFEFCKATKTKLSIVPGYILNRRQFSQITLFGESNFVSTKVSRSRKRVRGKDISNPISNDTAKIILQRGKNQIIAAGARPLLSPCIFYVRKKRFVQIRVLMSDASQFLDLFSSNGFMENLSILVTFVDSYR